MYCEAIHTTVELSTRPYGQVYAAYAAGGANYHAHIVPIRGGLRWHLSKDMQYPAPHIGSSVLLVLRTDT